MKIKINGAQSGHFGTVKSLPALEGWLQALQHTAQEHDALTEEPNRSLEERSTGRMGRKQPHSIAHPTQPSSPQRAGSSVQL